MECSKHILVITLQYLLRFAISVTVTIVIASYVRQIVDPYDGVGTFFKGMLSQRTVVYSIIPFFKKASRIMKNNGTIFLLSILLEECPHEQLFFVPMSHPTYYLLPKRKIN